MRRRTASTHTWGVELDSVRNPLLRRSDRVQATTKRIITALMMLMLPVAVWIGVGTMSGQQARVIDQQTNVHQSTAITTEAADATPEVQTEFTAAAPTASAAAQWTYRGVQHQGTVTVPTGSAAGTTSTIWVDQRGDRSGPPTTHTDAVAASLFTGIGVFFLAGVLLVGGYSMLKFRLDAHRHEQWDRELYALTA